MRRLKSIQIIKLLWKGIVGSMVISMLFYYLIPSLNGIPDFKWFPGLKQVIIIMIALLPIIIDYQSKKEEINNVMNSNFLAI